MKIGGEEKIIILPPMERTRPTRTELEKLESEEKQIQLEYRIKQLNEILRKSIEGLKLSKSSEEIFLNKRIVVETLCNLAIAYAELNKRAELLNTLIDLKFYTNKNINELLSAIQTVELIIKEGINIKIDFLDRLKVLLHRIKREHEIFEP
ncbi:MAG: hypothetical protein NZ879_05425 [Archaeoglobaceae archaeon]|nr:hypothetical protein [Archaeoglobaceae archaeon]MDW8118406.1 hypothetical protein [Archaeoglobaceae archaeon]